MDCVWIAAAGWTTLRRPARSVLAPHPPASTGTSAGGPNAAHNDASLIHISQRIIT